MFESDPCTNRSCTDVSVLKTALVWMRVSIGIIRDDSETYSPYAFTKS